MWLFVCLFVCSFGPQSYQVLHLLKDLPMLCLTSGFPLIGLERLLLDILPNPASLREPCKDEQGNFCCYNIDFDLKILLVSR